MSSSDEDDRPLAMRNRANGSRLSPVLPAKISPTVDREVDMELETVDPGHKGDQITTAAAINPPVKNEPELEVRSSTRRARKPAVVEVSESEGSDAPLNKRRKINGVKAEEDDVPLAKRAKARASASPKATKRPPVKKAKESDGSDSDVPLAAVKQSKEKAAIQEKAAANAQKLRAADKKRKAPVKKEEESDGSDSDVPLAAAKQSKEKAAIQKKAAVNAQKLRPADKKRKAAVKKEEEESDSDVPLSNAKKPKKANGVKKQEESEDDLPLAKGRKTPVKKEAKVKAEPKGKAELKGKGRGIKKDSKEETPLSNDLEEEEEEEYQWWHAPENDGTKKWTTLEHNGVLFPPPYEPLPDQVKLKYDGQDVKLAPEAEEVAGFFGAMLQTQHAENPKFQENFFKDFQDVVKQSSGAFNTAGKRIKLTNFSKCDFTPMFEYFEMKKEEKKKLTSAEKKAIKAERDEMEKPYTFCVLDGRKEKVGNFRIEPPGLFRGRGDHPKTGKLKNRVQPEQVTINIGKGVKVPEPPAGHRWHDVVHDDSVTWLATWKENVNNNIKYVMLAATSSLKGLSDYKKFEKARELKKIIDVIRKDYTEELKNSTMAVRQRATAMYLIDQLALRAGNEKDNDKEADTVGCCSLRFEHVTLEPPNTVTFDFLGKDSIRFQQSTQVTPQVFKNLKIFKKPPKDVSDKIFDRLDTGQLNKHLGSYMEGLSAKVFRTYNASWTMQQELAKIPLEGSVHDKFAAYNAANKKVAELCNHQRTVSTTHAATMAKADEKIRAARYQKLRLKRQILFLEPKRKKQDPEYFKPDEEINDPDWIKEHQKVLLELEREKINKKFEKDNEKRIAEGESEMKQSELKTRLMVVDELAQEFKKENRTGVVEPKTKATSVEKLEAAIDKLETRIKNMETEKSVRDDNKTVALGTSKINYIDPRLTVMFCKKYDVPIEKLFPKTLREKFKWAIESTDENWVF